MLGHAPPTTPVPAPPHRWRSSSGRAYCVDYCRRHHCCRLPARGWGLAEPSWAMLRRLPPSPPRRTVGARPRAGLIASITAAVTTVAVSPHGVGASPSQAGPFSADDPRPRPAAPLALVLGLHFLRRPLLPSPLLSSPRAGLGSRRAKLGRHDRCRRLPARGCGLRHAGQESADNPRPCTAALLALVLGLGCSSRLLSPSPRTWSRLRPSFATPGKAPPTTPAPVPQPCWRSPSGRAARVDCCRRLLARGCGPAAPCRATLR